MKKRNWLALILALTMLLSPISVFAEDVWAPADESAEDGTLCSFSAINPQFYWGSKKSFR